MQTCAVIGYGRFGKLAASILSRSFRVVVADRKPPRGLPRGITAAPLGECAAADIVILAVPVRSLEGVISKLAPSIRPGTLVADVCAVKDYSAKVMKSGLPKGTEIVGTHPLFGPDSYHIGSTSGTVILTPIAITRPRMYCVARAIRKLGLSVSVMTPREHDKLMARTLFVTQTLGRAAEPFIRIPATVTTANFLMLRQISDASCRDSKVVLQDLFRYNPWCRDVSNRLLKSTSRIIKSL
jgi:prephenate dehydrogenase